MNYHCNPDELAVVFLTLFEAVTSLPDLSISTVKCSEIQRFTG